MQICKRCNINKSLSEYYKTTDRKSGRKTICKECIKKDPLTEQRKQVMREYGKQYHLKTKYNLTLDEYNLKLIAQNHKCAICGIDEKETVKGKLFVDHCHTTNIIRGLLCNNCNTGIGFLKDSISSLSNAITYLDKYKNMKQGE
jgi:hypothetical protein